MYYLQKCLVRDYFYKFASLSNIMLAFTYLFLIFFVFLYTNTNGFFSIIILFLYFFIINNLYEISKINIYQKFKHKDKSLIPIDTKSLYFDNKLYTIKQPYLSKTIINGKDKYYLTFDHNRYYRISMPTYYLIEEKLIEQKRNDAYLIYKLLLEIERPLDFVNSDEVKNKKHKVTIHFILR